MATTTKKAPPKKGKAIESKTGAGAAIAERSKDTKKPTFGKAAPKTVKPAAPKSAAAKTAKPAARQTCQIRYRRGPSIATRVMRKVKNTASGAVAMAASVIGKDGGKSKAKSK